MAPLEKRKNNESSVNFAKFKVFDPPLSMLAMGFDPLLWRNATLEGLKRTTTNKKAIKKFSVTDEIFLENARNFFGNV